MADDDEVYEVPFDPFEIRAEAGPDTRELHLELEAFYQKAGAKARKTVYLKAFAQWGIVGKACHIAGVTYSALRKWREEDEDFVKAEADAFEMSVDLLESEAVRRAIEGVLEPDYHQGQVVGHTRKFSDSLLKFMLSARRPEKFRERVDVSLGKQQGEEPVRIYMPSNGREVVTVRGKVVDENLPWLGKPGKNGKH